MSGPPRPPSLLLFPRNAPVPTTTNFDSAIATAGGFYQLIPVPVTARIKHRARGGEGREGGETSERCGSASSCIEELIARHTTYTVSVKKTHAQESACLRPTATGEAGSLQIGAGRGGPRATPPSHSHSRSHAIYHPRVRALRKKTSRRETPKTLPTKKERGRAASAVAAARMRRKSSRRTGEGERDECHKRE